MDAYCINLASRPDRMEALHADIKRLSLPWNIIRYDAVPMGRIGCGTSHQNLIKLAADQQMEQILVLEDDVLFTEDSYTQMERCLAALPDDWDILWGGFYKMTKGGVIPMPEITGITPIFKIAGRFMGTQFILYRKTAYERMLQWNPSAHGHDIDIYLCERVQQDPRFKPFNIYTSVPFIATQRDGMSNISNNISRYSNLFSRPEMSLLKRADPVRYQKTLKQRQKDKIAERQEQRRQMLEKRKKKGRQQEKPVEPVRPRCTHQFIN